MNDFLISMKDICKKFPGVIALDNCSFNLRKGEVHALVGENGAGKSTLMKILSGAISKDSGSIIFKGSEVEIHSPRFAQNLGISIIHQELNLMPHLTVAENIYIGREPRKFLKFLLDKKKLNEQTAELLEKNHIKLDPSALVSGLSIAKQQMVEIAKALSFNSEVLIMDEPTAALTEAEIEELFTIIRHHRQEGVGIIYISHRMDELKKISDSVTVMRDGCFIGRSDMDKITIDEIIQMMVGREISITHKLNAETEGRETVLEVRNLSRGREIRNVSFSLKKGEILGFAGLMGAGRTEVARAVFGADKTDSGEIFVNGEKVSITSPADAIRSGIGYLSEDRKRYGLVLGMDIESNLVMAAYRKFLGFLGWVITKRTSETSRELVDRLRIKTPGVSQKVKNLSGGNQQKVVIGKWLTRNSDILIFDEPTRGIDVGAKNEIFRLLNDLTSQGKSIIMISSELPEILRMSNRIVVMCEGRITGELDGSTATQEQIMHLATMRDAV